MMYLNPDLKVVYTVSPVRHLKDGFTENSIGKAHLLDTRSAVARRRWGFDGPARLRSTNDKLKVRTRS